MILANLLPYYPSIHRPGVMQKWCLFHNYCYLMSSTSPSPVVLCSLRIYRRTERRRNENNENMRSGRHRSGAESRSCRTPSWRPRGDGRRRRLC